MLSLYFLLLLCKYNVRQSFVLKSSKIKSNSIPMSGSIPHLNYLSVWNHRSPKMSAMQTNVVVCRAFYHARSGAPGSITNEILLLRGPSGEIWWFPLSVWLYFFPRLFILFILTFFDFLFLLIMFVLPAYLHAYFSSALPPLQTTFVKLIRSLIDESNSFRHRRSILTALLSTKLSVTGLLSLLRTWI